MTLDMKEHHSKLDEQTLEAIRLAKVFHVFHAIQREDYEDTG